MRKPWTAFVFLAWLPFTPAQQSGSRYADRRAALQKQGLAAMQSETARVAAQPCSEQENTASTSACLRAQAAQAEANYKSSVASISGLLQLLPPDASPPERADARETRTNFRLAEARWLRYRDAQCEAVQLMSCEPDLTHRHMEELGMLYDRLFR